MRYLIACLVLGFAMTAQAAPLERFYGHDPLQTLDVSPLPGATHAPILIMVHGGAWMVGDKTDVTVSEPKRSFWAMRGYMFVSVNYRLTPQADALDQADDVASAVKYVIAHAREWGGDPDNIVLMGHSAGAHLVSLLGANPAKFGLKPWRATVSLDSAAYDVPAIMNRKHFTYYEPAFGEVSDDWDEASPIAQLQKGATPFYLVCTPQGPFLCSEAQAFADKAIKLGTPSVVDSEDMEHIEINDRVGEPGAYTTNIANFIGQFIR